MEANKKQKDFDCLEMKRELQSKACARVKGMTMEERIAYINAAPRLCGYRNEGLEAARR